MPIAQPDIKFFKSAATDSDGGAISATEITDNVLNNLFDDVSGDEAQAGDIEYRKIFIKNNHGSLTWIAIKAWIESLTSSGDDEIAISLSTNLTGSNATGDGQSYVAPTAKTHGDVLVVGNLTAGAYKDIWIRRTVSAGAAAYTNDTAILKAEGETAA